MPCCIICSNICFSSLVKSHFPIAVGRSCRARPSAAPARGRVTDLHPSSCETAASSPRPSPHAGQGRLLSSRAFGLPAALPLTAVPLRNPSLLRRELSALCSWLWAAPSSAFARHGSRRHPAPQPAATSPLAQSDRRARCSDLQRFPGFVTPASALGICSSLLCSPQPTALASPFRSPRPNPPCLLFPLP